MGVSGAYLVMTTPEATRIPYKARKRLGLDVGEGWKTKELTGRRSADRTYPTVASSSAGGGDPQSDHDDGIKVGFEETPSQPTLREPTRGASMNKLAFAFLTEIEKTALPLGRLAKTLRPAMRLKHEVAKGYEAEGLKGAAKGVLAAGERHPYVRDAAIGTAAFGAGALGHRLLFGGKKEEK